MIGIIQVNDVELFKKINCFKCDIGIITPEFCRRLRSRPQHKEKAGQVNYNFDFVPRKPEECLNCKQYIKLTKQVQERRIEYARQGNF